MTMGWNETQTQTSWDKVRCAKDECDNNKPEPDYEDCNTTRILTCSPSVSNRCTHCWFSCCASCRRWCSCRCDRPLNLYPKFLHISHRENGYFVLSLHLPSITTDNRQLLTIGLRLRFSPKICFQRVTPSIVNLCMHPLLLTFCELLGKTTKIHSIGKKNSMMGAIAGISRMELAWIVVLQILRADGLMWSTHRWRQNDLSMVLLFQNHWERFTHSFWIGANSSIWMQTSSVRSCSSWDSRNSGSFKKRSWIPWKRHLMHLFLTLWARCQSPCSGVFPNRWPWGRPSLMT